MKEWIDINYVYWDIFICGYVDTCLIVYLVYFVFIGDIVELNVEVYML